MSWWREEAKQPFPTPPTEDDGDSSGIRELRAALSGPYVRLHRRVGADVLCWISTVAFRCPTCATENIVTVGEKTPRWESITCGDCGEAFDLEVR
jgi:hypothetical protein